MSAGTEGGAGLFYGWVLLTLVEIEGEEGKSYRFAVVGFETDEQKANEAPIAWPLAEIKDSVAVLVVTNSLVEGYHRAGTAGCAACFDVIADPGASVTFLGIAEVPAMLAECVQEYEILAEEAAPEAGAGGSDAE